jgi:hypothetical protein
MRKLYTVILLALLAACAGEPKQVETAEAVDSTFVEETKTEEQMVQEFDYPVDSNYGAVLVMVNTMIYPDDYNAMDKEHVFALFKGADGFYLDKVTTKGEVMNQEDSNDEYIKLVTEHKDSCIFFISGVNYLTKRKVDFVEIADGTMPVGRTLELSLKNGYKQKLVANGTFRDGNETDNFNNMTSYRLMLFGEKNNAEIVDMLVAHDSFDDAAITILFAGDIDGDGLMDYLIETARKYGNSSPALYLSKPAASDNLIKIIDVAGSAGGC